MKKILSLMLVLALVFSACSLTACDLINSIMGSSTTTVQTVPPPPKASEGLEYSLNNNGTGYTVVGIGECTDTELLIPEEYEGKPVTGIDDEAFFENEDIVSVVLPESILSIGDYAFSSCTSLKYITINEGLLEIGNGAFSSCLALEAITIPTTVTEIPSQAFYGCFSLKSVDLHSEITSIGDNAFTFCVSLESLSIPGGIGLDKFQMFYMCLNSLKAYEIDGEEDFLYTVDGNLYAKLDYGMAFFGNYLLSYAMGKGETEFTVPEDVTEIYPGAFSFFPWDTMDVELINGNNMPEFKYRSSLNKVTISEGVLGIQMMSFVFCTDLETVVIPKTMQYIFSNAFMYCPNLETIEFNGTIEEWNAITKDREWYVGCNIKTVKCTDGDICPHKFGSWETVKEPSTTETGLEQRVCSVCGEAEEREIPKKPENITIWVSISYGVREMTEDQIKRFISEHPEYQNYTFTIETVSEGDAASELLKDLDSAPDIFCFAQDQLLSLVNANALDAPSPAHAETIKATNDASSIIAATHDGTIYAYPLTSDNGYYLYYDSRYISDEEAKTLEGIIAACERSGMKFGYDITNGWYAASFFFSQPVGSSEPLCVSEWTYSYQDRIFTDKNDTFNSENGLIAMKAMQKLTQSSAWRATADEFSGSAAMVTGIWNANSAECVYGEYTRATKLPTFTMDGKEYQLGSFSGNKLMGVKPQTNEEKRDLLHKLSAYLSGEECQIERYYEFMWGPSNINAQANEDVKANIYLSALLSQNVYAQPQGNYPSSWWDITLRLGKSAHDAQSDADLIAALATYEEEINSLIK